MTADLHTLVGAYALNALTPDEHEQFNQHLATCAACRAELAELQATAARLSDATWQSPPPGMKARLLDAIARTPQDRPLIPATERSRWSRTASASLVAAAVLAVVVSLGAFFVERGRVGDLERQQTALEQQQTVEEQQQTEIAAILAAPDTQAHAARLDNGGSVRVLVSPALDQAVVVMDDLPTLDAEHSYQLWRVHRRGPDSETVLSGAESTGAVTRLVSDLGDAQALSLTVEPAGGSAAPTTAPIVNIALT